MQKWHFKPELQKTPFLSSAVDETLFGDKGQSGVSFKKQIKYRESPRERELNFEDKQKFDRF